MRKILLYVCEALTCSEVDDFVFSFINFIPSDINIIIFTSLIGSNGKIYEELKKRNYIIEIDNSISRIGNMSSIMFFCKNIDQSDMVITINTTETNTDLLFKLAKNRGKDLYQYLVKDYENKISSSYDGFFSQQKFIKVNSDF